MLTVRLGFNSQSIRESLELNNSIDQASDR